MAKWLVAGSIGLPALFAAVLAQRILAGASVWTAFVYLAASRICHQLPERSFHTAGVQWPICGRCSGLYLGGAVGGLLAGWIGSRVSQRDLRTWLVLAAIPTGVTFILEWIGLARVTNTIRAVAGVPLGMAIAVLVIHAAGSSKNRSDTLTAHVVREQTR